MSDSIIKNTAQLIGRAVARGSHKPAPTFRESDDVVQSRIDESAQFLDYSLGVRPTDSTEIDPEVNRYLNLMSPTRDSNTTEGNTVLTGSARGKEYTIIYLDGEYSINVRGEHGIPVFVSSFNNSTAAVASLKAMVPGLVIHTDNSKTALQESVASFLVGDRIQTIKGGQQEGTIERIDPTNGKVYHRHDSGTLYASYPSNLKLIDRPSHDEWATLNAKYAHDNHTSDMLSQMRASGWSVDQAENELNKRGVIDTHKLFEEVDSILKEIGKKSLSELNESDRSELFDIASSYLV